MKKRIIFVTKALWIGGIETSLVNLLNYFDYEKYDVTLLVLQAELNLLERINKNCHVLILDREKTFSNEEAYKYKRIFHLTEDSESPSILHKAMMWTVPVIKWIENRLYIQYVKKFMNKETFNTCIIYSDVVAETAIRSIKADKYLMYYHHGVMRHVYHDEIAYKKCDKIIAVSDNQASELKRFVPTAANKIVSIHNLIDVEGIQKKASEDILEEFNIKKFNIVSVGRVSHEKGMDIAVKTCSELIKRGYTNICWWIVGDGPAMREVKQVISEEKVEKYIQLVGMKSNPYPYIKKANLYVQPSRFEGYPMTLLEALVIGQPVVTTDNNGAKEIIIENYTGIFCTLDVKDIGNRIEKLIKEQDNLDSLKYNVKKLNFEKKNRYHIENLNNYL